MYQDDGSSSITSSPFQTFPMMKLSPSLGSSQHAWLKGLKSEERGLYLIHLLLNCANYVATGNLEDANLSLDQISHLASPNGDTMQRIASYFTEALADRIIKSWPGLYKALHSTRMPMVTEEMLVRKLFYEYFPFLKVAFVVTNRAIIEAMEGEKMVHIIDLNASEPTQWRALIQDLSARPEGPPHLRITGVHHQKELLQQMAQILIEDAEKLDIPFQFNPVVSKLENLDIEKLRVKTGEALAISSVLQLHSLLASDVEISKSPLKNSNTHHFQRIIKINHNNTPSYNSAASSSTKLESFLSGLYKLSPKIMVVAEQESNHNGATLMDRLSESLYYYAALFDCLESTLPRTSMERLKMEKRLFGEEIKSIISCEGGERKERHEKIEKWIQRLEFSGFGKVPLSYYGMLQGKRLLQNLNCEGYKIKEVNGCVVICWQDRPLYSLSTWRCRR